MMQTTMSPAQMQMMQMAWSTTQAPMMQAAWTTTQAPMMQGLPAGMPTMAPLPAAPPSGPGAEALKKKAQAMIEQNQKLLEQYRAWLTTPQPAFASSAGVPMLTTQGQ